MFALVRQAFNVIFRTTAWLFGFNDDSLTTQNSRPTSAENPENGKTRSGGSNSGHDKRVKNWNSSTSFEVFPETRDNSNQISHAIRNENSEGGERHVEISNSLPTLNLLPHRRRRNSKGKRSNSSSNRPLSQNLSRSEGTKAASVDGSQSSNKRSERIEAASVDGSQSSNKSIEGLEAASGNGFQLVCRRRKSFDPSAFRTQNKYRNEHSPKAQTKKTVLLGFEESVKPHTLPSKQPQYHVNKKKGSDVPSSNAPHIVKGKDERSDFSSSAPKSLIVTDEKIEVSSRPYAFHTKDNYRKKRGSKAQSYLEALLRSVESIEPDTLPSKPTQNLFKKTERSDVKSCNTPHLLNREEEGSELPNAPPSLIVSGSEESEPSSAFINEASCNTKQKSDAQSNQSHPVIFSNREELDALTNETRQPPINKNEGSYTPPDNKIPCKEPDFPSGNQLQPMNKKENDSNAPSIKPICRPIRKIKGLDASSDNRLPCKEEPDFPSGNQLQPINKNENNANAPFNKTDWPMMDKKEGSGAASNNDFEPWSFGLNLPTMFQKRDSCGNLESNAQFLEHYSFYTDSCSTNKTSYVTSGEQSELLISNDQGSNQQEGNQNLKSKEVNIFVAGPENCGKILLIETFVDEQVDVSTINDCGCVATKTHKKTHESSHTDAYLKIWYVSNLLESILLMGEECSRLKSVIILVYSFVVPQTLFDIVWYINIIRSRIRYKVPIVLVGNKLDLRTRTTIDEFDKEGMYLNFPDCGLQVKENYELPAYFECSGQTGENVSDLFRYAADLVL